MKLLLFILIILQVVICKADNAFYPRNNSEFILYLPDIEKNFNEMVKSPNKCTPANYRKMEQTLEEAFVWYHFSRSVEKLAVINGIFKTLTIGELPDQNTRSYEQQMEFNGDFDPTIKEAIQELNLWYDRECNSKKDYKDAKQLKRNLANE